VAERLADHEKEPALAGILGPELVQSQRAQ